MEWVCGAFTPELMPDWISKVGPAIAALIAVGVYSLNRWNTRSDLKAKRKVLRRMLVGQIREVRAYAESLIRLLHRGNETDPDSESWVSMAAGGTLTIPSTKHLLTLQMELIKVADHGDELIAEFIESCREYEHAVTTLAAFEESALLRDKFWKEMLQFNVAGLRSDLEKIISTARQAEQQLARLVRTGTLTRFIRRARSWWVRGAQARRSQ